MDKTDPLNPDKRIDPAGEFPAVLVVFDGVGVTGSLPDALEIAIAFPLSGQGGHHKRMFSELNTRLGWGTHSDGSAEVCPAVPL